MLKGVFFDLDGVIIDTERDGHRIAFNQSFVDFGIPDAVWDVKVTKLKTRKGCMAAKVLSFS